MGISSLNLKMFETGRQLPQFDQLGIWKGGHQNLSIYQQLSVLKSHCPMFYTLYERAASYPFPVTVPIFRTCHNPASLQKTSIIYTSVGIGEDKRLTLAMYSYNGTCVWLTEKGLRHWKVLNELFRAKSDAATVIVPNSGLLARIRTYFVTCLI